MTKIVVHSYEKRTSKLTVKNTANCLSWYILYVKLIVWSCSQLYRERHTCRSRPTDKGEGGGRWSSRPWHKGGGGGGCHPKKKFWPFRPQFGLKIRGEPGPPGPLPWIRLCGREMYKNVKRTCKACYAVFRLLLSEKFSVSFQINGLHRGKEIRPIKNSSGPCKPGLRKQKTKVLIVSRHITKYTALW